MMRKMKQDKRSRRTRAWLLDTLLELLDEKDYAEITITELTDKADIARPTFYRNYTSKDDILLFKMDEILDEYLKEVPKYLEKKNDTKWDYEVTLMVSVWQKNRTLFKALQKAGLSLQVLEKLSGFFSLFHMKVQNLKKLDEYNQCLVYYLSGGVYMVLNKWFEGEMKTPHIEVITDIFNKAACQIDKMAKEFDGC